MLHFQAGQRPLQVEADLRDPEPAVAGAVRPVPLLRGQPGARGHRLGQGPAQQGRLPRTVSCSGFRMFCCALLTIPSTKMSKSNAAER